MKQRILLITALAGIAFAGCNTSSKKEQITDSGLVDTLWRADSIVVDTTPMKDKLLIDSM